MNKKIVITEAEFEIMEILWQFQEPLSAYEIRQKLHSDNNWERTTILTLIRRLLDKKVIEQEKKEVYYYRPILKKEEYVQEETKQFVNKLYKGNTKNLMVALFEDQSLTEEDMKELKDYFTK